MKQKMKLTLRGYLYLFACLAGLGFVGSLLFGQVTSVRQITLTARYTLLRAEANENSSVIDVSSNEGNFASKPSAAVRVPTYQNSSEANALEIIFAGGDADGDTFSWKLWAWRHGNGPAVMICDGTGVRSTEMTARRKPRQNPLVMKGGEESSRGRGLKQSHTLSCCNLFWGIMLRGRAYGTMRV